ncbi:hypothetical protein [Enterobacter sp.]|uniref:hypothetical protein n=1 Tax=Enterobacter sp. TaxID=42895 RepID=UPI00296FB392|nr:hypothetical protein [Enterobacter sp.]
MNHNGRAGAWEIFHGAGRGAVMQIKEFVKKSAKKSTAGAALLFCIFCQPRENRQKIA